MYNRFLFLHWMTARNTSYWEGTYMVEAGVIGDVLLARETIPRYLKEDILDALENAISKNFKDASSNQGV